MSGIVSESIQQFIISTTPKKDNSPQKKRYKKSSRLVHYKGNKQVNSEIIINESGIGNLRELSVISNQKMNPYLEIDGINTLLSANSWNELAEISLYSSTIVAQTNENDFILSFNKLKFMKNIFLRIDFENKGTIKRAIGTYDLCEEIL